jgi:uncharacterized SAM-binding protein YcdF (DUF218 family)
MIPPLFAFKKVIVNLILPPASLVILSVVGLLLLRRWPRTARALLWSATTCWLLLSLPVVERWLIRSLHTPSLTEQNVSAAQAIVILGGGVKTATPEEGNSLSTFALERVRYGALLSKRYHLPVLVTGGGVFGNVAESDVMAQVLHNDFNVDVRWNENRALDTEDNARYSAALLQREHIDTVLLVTQDFHMPRALRECRRYALKCISAPITSTSHMSDSWIQELPNHTSFNQSVLALHELLGLLAQRD